MSTSLAKLEPRNVAAMIENTESGIARLLPPDYDLQLFAAQIMSACIKNPKLLECDKASLLLAARQAAEMGLNPSGTTQEAFLIPYQNKVQFQFGVDGLILKALEGDANMLRIDAHAVYEGDDFAVELGSDDARVIHTPRFAHTDDAHVIAAYAVIRWKDGSAPRVEVMTRAELDKVKSASKAGNVWQSWYAEKAKVAVTRRALKRLPKLQPKVKRALELDNEAYDMERGETAPPRRVSMPQPKREPAQTAVYQVAPESDYTSADKYNDDAIPPTVGAEGEIPFEIPADDSAIASPASSGLFITGISDPKTGTGKTGKPWKQWTIDFSDGRKMTTFSETLYQAAVNAHTNGEAVSIETKMNGQYENLTSIRVAQ